MTSADAIQTLARLNHYLSILSQIEAKPIKTAEDLEVVAAVQAGASEAPCSLRAPKDAKRAFEKARG